MAPIHWSYIWNRDKSHVDFFFIYVSIYIYINVCEHISKLGHARLSYMGIELEFNEGSNVFLPVVIWNRCGCGTIPALCGRSSRNAGSYGRWSWSSSSVGVLPRQSTNAHVAAVRFGLSDYRWGEFLLYSFPWLNATQNIWATATTAPTG